MENFLHFVEEKKQFTLFLENKRHPQTEVLLQGTNFLVQNIVKKAQTHTQTDTQTDTHKLRFHPPIFMCILEYRIKKKKKTLDGNGKMRINSKNAHKKTYAHI